MKAWITLLGVAGIGFGVGFFAGERYGKKKQLEDDIRAENDDGIHVAFYPDKMLEERIQAGRAAKEYAPPVTAANDIDLEQAHEDMDTYMSQFEHPEEEDDDEETERRNVPVKNDETFIHVIDEDLYEACEDLSPHEWEYYEDDQVTCNEDNERVENPEDYLGREPVDIFYDFPDNETVYIRNTWVGEKYKITKIHDSYARAVEGMDADFETYPGFNGTEE